MITARPKALSRLNEAPPWWRKVDVVLLGSALAISLSGLLMVLSATSSGNAGAGIALRQTLWIVIGLGLMCGFAMVDYRSLRKHLPWAYGAALLVLALVLTPLGSESKGAQAWFQLGGLQFQPSEFAKIVLILALASFCARQSHLADRHVAVLVVATGIPVGLILLQPDLGTVLVFGAIAFLAMTVAGASMRSLAGIVVLGVLAIVLMVQLGVLAEYQLDRLGVFLDPASNTEQAAYNLNQSKIAIGSGQVIGKGLFLGTQTNLRYVPEQHTDFIFTVVGEELGFLGAATLLGLFAVLFWRIWLAARDAPDRFGTLICAGVLAMLAFHVFENVGMTMGIMPITGIPLPLVSYGGSAMLATFMALGIVMSVRYRTQRGSG